MEKWKELVAVKEALVNVWGSRYHVMATPFQPIENLTSDSRTFFDSKKGA
jgi:hypothetical protein